MLSEQPLMETSALHLLHRAGQCADELFVSNVGASDLTPRQYEVLKTVSESKDPSQTALVMKTGIDRSTLADIVRRMVERGLLSRKRTPHDARRYAVTLTDKGQAALEHAAPTVRSTNDRLLAALPADSRVPFLNALARIIDAIGPELNEKSK